MATFWTSFERARVFEDREYGQWGLELVPRDEAQRFTERFKAERVRDYRDGDLVIGKFLGDSELLVVRADEQRYDFGSVLVALPLDPRERWHEPARSLGAFLLAYARAEGQKFWEDARVP